MRGHCSSKGAGWNILGKGTVLERNSWAGFHGRGLWWEMKAGKISESGLERLDHHVPLHTKHLFPLKNIMLLNDKVQINAYCFSELKLHCVCHIILF